MASIIERFKKTPPEITDRRDQAKNAFGEIAQLAPHLRGGYINYASRTLVSSLLKEMSYSKYRYEALGTFISELQLQPDDAFLSVYFRNDRKDPRQSLCLSRSTNWFSDQVQVFFQKNNFQQGDIMIKTPNMTHAVIENDLPSSPSYVRNEQLLPLLFTHLKEDLQSARQDWVSSLEVAKTDYLRVTGQKISTQTSRTVIKLIEKISAAFPDGEFTIVGEPIPTRERGRLRLFTDLKMTEDTANQIAQQDRSFDRDISQSYSNEHLPHKTGTYALNLENNITISLQTYYPNEQREGHYYPSNPALSSYCISKAEQDFAHFLAGDKKHRWGVGGVNEAVLLYINPNKAPGIEPIFAC